MLFIVPERGERARAPSSPALFGVASPHLFLFWGILGILSVRYPGGTRMDVAELNDAQLNRYIADRRASYRLAKAEMEDALDEWRARHGGEEGTRVELAGVVVHLEANRRWDEETARSVLADRPELMEQLQTTVLDRARAKEVLDEDIYILCQKPSGKPRARVTLN